MKYRCTASNSAIRACIRRMSLWGDVTFQLKMVVALRLDRATYGSSRQTAVPWTGSHRLSPKVWLWQMSGSSVS